MKKIEVKGVRVITDGELVGVIARPSKAEAMEERYQVPSFASEADARKALKPQRKPAKKKTADGD